MKSIILYSRELKAQNLYPRRIISPPAPNKCCASRMEVVGKPRVDDQGRRFCYKRCRVCGFALRHFLDPVPVVLAPESPEAKGPKPGAPRAPASGTSPGGPAGPAGPTTPPPAPAPAVARRAAASKPAAGRHRPPRARAVRHAAATRKRSEQRRR